MKRRILVIIAVFSVTVVFCACMSAFCDGLIVLWHRLAEYWRSPANGADAFMMERGLGTRIGLWQNGYFNLFICFLWFGYLTWLAIPLTIYFIVTIKRRQRWEYALFTVYWLSFLFISVKGYSNERYALSLFPFTIAAVLFLGWEALGNRTCRRLMLPVCVFLAGLNVYQQWAPYYRSYLNEKLLQARWDSIPQDIVNFLDQEAEPSGYVLVCNEPFFYYYTSRKGIHYKNPEMMKVYHAENQAQAVDVLKNQLKVRYVLVSARFEQTARETMLRGLVDILHQDCDPIIDDFGRRLYRLRLPVSPGAAGGGLIAGQKPGVVI